MLDMPSMQAGSAWGAVILLGVLALIVALVSVALYLALEHGGNGGQRDYDHER